MSLPRFHVEGIGPGARIELPEHSAHHAREVLRLRAGETIRVFDGRGAEYEAILERVTRHEVHARIHGPLSPRPESALRITLALSPLKGDRMELVVQKATELGVAAIRPVVTVRTDAAARPALKGTRQDRWEKVASGAAEQCGRAVVPEVAPTTTLRALLAEPFEGPRLHLSEIPGTPPFASLVETRPTALLILVGPAGGFDSSEVTALQAAGFRAASLGPRILRSETAAVAAVAVAQALWGDLGVLEPSA
jgi:16S rRNA (uracil1498-N3)-methyltransferase